MYLLLLKFRLGCLPTAAGNSSFCKGIFVQSTVSKFSSLSYYNLVVTDFRFLTVTYLHSQIQMET
jgi:hypothetical protein